MESFGWILWVVVGLALIVGEVFTLGFVLFWFGIGALIAALMGFLGFGIGIQFLTFAIVSIALTAMSRKIFANYYSHDDSDLVKTAVDSLPGQIGLVSAPSKGPLQLAEVKVFGTTWNAIPEEGEEPFAEGEKVEVVRVKGSSIYVRRIGRLPEWRESASSQYPER